MSGASDDNYSGITWAIGSAGAQQSTPRFNPLGQIFLSGKTVISDVDGNLWQIDADNASMRRVSRV